MTWWWSDDRNLSQVSLIIKYCCVRLKTYLLLFFNSITQRDVLYKNKNHSAKLVHSGTKKSTLQLSFSDSYHWLLLISSLITQNAANPLPRLHSCYQRQAAACCICIHIRQMWFTNYDGDMVKWYLREVHDGEIAATFVSWSGETWFHLGGYVTSRNNRYTSAENLMLIHRLPIHDVKGWCVMLLLH
jgi:hypothetical protein